MKRELPDAASLPRPRYSGWACVWCGHSLMNVMGVPAGRAHGWIGAHDMSVEVFQCPPGVGCATGPDEAALEHPAEC
ncbi:MULTISPECIES: hypothetical protein [Streptomyces]|uniref:Uncharacterized protein n=2 Tax=Streptomyces TaxID=1883 RepID=A0A2U9P0T2_STRAS|nr:hypothetical protein [Streptomyces actuosus]AWT43187.1 hypothetical protein DMT42_13220 [Streptomyces actuosus]MBM4824661.1 hypothetical protein [Streptomyces actuosus]